MSAFRRRRLPWDRIFSSAIHRLKCVYLIDNSNINISWEKCNMMKTSFMHFTSFLLWQKALNIAGDLAEQKLLMLKSYNAFFTENSRRKTFWTYEKLEIYLEAYLNVQHKSWTSFKWRNLCFKRCSEWNFSLQSVQ